jgi:NAD-dependent deacetylase
VRCFQGIPERLAALSPLQYPCRIDRIITQNVDRLHHKAGTPAEKVVELHGTTHV